ncbi:MAG TPA: TIM barrel protein, partial [Thermoleophilia bacterium]|nr:TIM barrel protein [Thermoleophilia bacterium]
MSGPFTLPPRIGLPTQVYPELPLGEALERLAPYTQLVEIDSFGLHTVLSLRNRNVALGSRLRLSVHGPYGHDIDPANPDESLRRFTVDQHRRHLEAAAELGALVYVAHSDYRPPPAPRDPARVAAMQRTIADLEVLQAEYGVPIGVENMPGVGIGTFTAPGDLELGELGLTLDVGHAAVSGTLDGFLADPRGRLIHM